MSSIMSIMALMKAHSTETILAGLLLVSEGMAEIPSIQANSIFQAVRNGLSAAQKQLFGEKPPEQK